MLWTKRRALTLANPFLFAPEFSRRLLPRPRRLMLLVNPFSGRGQAMQWCQTQILPMIREANISYNLIQTGNAKAGADMWRTFLSDVLNNSVCLRAAEPRPGADPRDLAARVGRHRHCFGRRPPTRGGQSAGLLRKDGNVWWDLITRCCGC